MKILQGHQDSKTRKIVTGTNYTEINVKNIIYNDGYWIVIWDNSGSEESWCYVLLADNNSICITCFSEEQIKEYIPDFKLPKNKKDGKEEDSE